MFVKAATVEQLERMSPLPVLVQGRQILLVRNGAGLFAVENSCPHQSRTLETAQMTGATLRCIFHGVEFDMSTGAITRDAGYIGLGPVKAYRVEERDGDIVVELNEDE